MEKSNLTFRMYVGNRYGRQENHSAQMQIHIDRESLQIDYNLMQIVGLF